VETHITIICPSTNYHHEATVKPKRYSSISFLCTLLSCCVSHRSQLTSFVFLQIWCSIFNCYQVACKKSPKHDVRELKWRQIHPMLLTKVGRLNLHSFNFPSVFQLLREDIILTLSHYHIITRLKWQWIVYHCAFIFRKHSNIFPPFSRQTY
jgi:hypothetical protein